MRLPLWIASAGIVAALTGCGDPAPSTPIAPDLPASSSGKSAGPSDLAKLKEKEHGGSETDRAVGRG